MLMLSPNNLIQGLQVQLVFIRVCKTNPETLRPE
jgi:hypothetical protein